MDITDKYLVETIESIFKSIAIVVGAIWLYFRFIRTRENHPKIQFDIDLRFLGRQDGKLLIEIIGTIVNKGLVRHWVRDFICDVLTLDKMDKVETGDKSINYQVKFFNRNPIKPRDNNVNNKSNRIVWIPENWYESFIDPGIEQKYTYLTSVGEETSFISIYSRFITKNADFQTSQKTYSIEQLEKK
jgi:hypothetical protein